MNLHFSSGPWLRNPVASGPRCCWTPPQLWLGDLVQLTMGKSAKRKFRPLHELNDMKWYRVLMILIYINIFVLLHEIHGRYIAMDSHWMSNRKFMDSKGPMAAEWPASPTCVLLQHPFVQQASLCVTAVLTERAPNGHPTGTKTPMAKENHLEMERLRRSLWLCNHFATKIHKPKKGTPINIHKHPCTLTVA